MAFDAVMVNTLDRISVIIAFHHDTAAAVCRVMIINFLFAVRFPVRRVLVIVDVFNPVKHIADQVFNHRIDRRVRIP